VIDFAQGWVWFACGLGATLLTALFVVGVVLVARRAEARTPRRR
jgi:hypothetical protein